MRRDGMGWDEMGWEEMRWDETRWDEKRWEEMRWYEKRWDEKYAKITGSVNFTSLCLSSSCFSMHGAACNHSRHVLFSREERWFWGRSSSQMRCAHMRVWSARGQEHGVRSHPRRDRTSRQGVLAQEATFSPGPSATVIETFYNCNALKVQRESTWNELRNYVNLVIKNLRQYCIFALLLNMQLLYCTVLNYTVLYCILYCTVL